ncbi:hypothetical protein HQ393_10410 [Chitinibacter bivalviorum]|uniref:TubC N-terminal docking domain-containing protein n=1 Tax=Chitinibacter bivalviorum TaxID=2739434 RepID=A0A7H9BJX2_9NEIS|nr:hypothetical protein [Chitinibacter bivalviorum]QLG88616.1 hypothetical protein HQ393_10410 [Chitinibacter bivalviorum]
MNSSDLLDVLTEAGLSLSLNDDGALKVTPKPSPEQSALIRAHKPELVKQLQGGWLHIADVLTAVTAGAALKSIGIDTEVTHWRWQVTGPDGECREVRCLPEPTEQAMRERYPDCKIEALPDDEPLPTSANSALVATDINLDGSYDEPDPPEWEGLSDMRRYQLRRARGYDNQQATKQALAATKALAESAMNDLHTTLADQTHQIKTPARFVDVGNLPIGTPCVFSKMVGQDEMTGKRRLVPFGMLREVKKNDPI